jgi:hypothetical protein
LEIGRIIRGTLSIKALSETFEVFLRQPPGPTRVDSHLKELKGTLGNFEELFSRAG